MTKACKFLQIFETRRNRWTDGECGTFANALHQHFGLPIYAAVEMARKDGDMTVIHAFVMGKGEDGKPPMVDAKGVQPPLVPSDISGETGYPGEESDFKVVPLSAEWLDENRAHLEDVVGNVPLALEYIEGHPDLFAGVEELSGDVSYGWAAPASNE